MDYNAFMEDYASLPQKERVLQFIRQNGYITSMDAYNIGITQLGARIYYLKQDGVKFTKERISKRTKNGLVFYDKYFVEAQ